MIFLSLAVSKFGSGSVPRPRFPAKDADLNRLQINDGNETTAEANAEAKAKAHLEENMAEMAKEGLGHDLEENPAQVHGQELSEESGQES